MTERTDDASSRATRRSGFARGETASRTRSSRCGSAPRRRRCRRRWAAPPTQRSGEASTPAWRPASVRRRTDQRAACSAQGGPLDRQRRPASAARAARRAERGLFGADASTSPLAARGGARRRRRVRADRVRARAHRAADGGRSARARPAAAVATPALAISGVLDAARGEPRLRGTLQHASGGGGRRVHVATLIFVDAAAADPLVGDARPLADGPLATRPADAAARRAVLLEAAAPELDHALAEPSRERRRRRRDGRRVVVVGEGGGDDERRRRERRRVEEQRDGGDGGGRRRRALEGGVADDGRVCGRVAEAAADGLVPEREEAAAADADGGGAAERRGPAGARRADPGGESGGGGSGGGGAVAMVAVFRARRELQAQAIAATARHGLLSNSSHAGREAGYRARTHGKTRGPRRAACRHAPSSASPFTTPPVARLPCRSPSRHATLHFLPDFAPSLNSDCAVSRPNQRCRAAAPHATLGDRPRAVRWTLRRQILLLGAIQAYARPDHAFPFWTYVENYAAASVQNGKPGVNEFALVLKCSASPIVAATDAAAAGARDRPRPPRGRSRRACRRPRHRSRMSTWPTSLRLREPLPSASKAPANRPAASRPPPAPSSQPAL